MALGTVFGESAITLSFAATQHESTAAGVREITELVGGNTFVTADGVPHITPGKKTVVAVEVDMYQDLAAAAMWRYLRENASTTGTLIVGGTSSLTESATNPEWNYTITGWAMPELNWAANTVGTTTAIFYVSATSVDVT